MCAGRRATLTHTVKITASECLFVRLWVKYDCNFEDYDDAGRDGDDINGAGGKFC